VERGGKGGGGKERVELLDSDQELRRQDLSDVDKHQKGVLTGAKRGPLTPSRVQVCGCERGRERRKETTRERERKGIKMRERES